MATRPDRLARAVVDAALKLYRRRLWREVPGDTFFSLRVPGEEGPMAASLIGQAGEEFGLAMFRGEGALGAVARLCLGADSETETEALELLTVSFEPWATVEKEYRRLALTAGLRASRERAVPMAIVRPAFEQGRPARRPELRTMLWALRGVLAAHDAGELRPIPLTDTGEAPKHVLELEVSGKPKQPEVTARLIAWPRVDELGTPPPPVALPRGLRKLPRTEDSWLVSLVPLPGRIEGDDRAVFGAFVGEERQGLVIGNTVTLGDELAPVTEMLTDALRAFGRPRAIVFGDRRLQAAYGPGLSTLGVDNSFDPDLPLGIELSEALRAGVGAPAPDPLTYWKELDRRVVGTLIDTPVGDVSARARTRYFGKGEDAERILTELAHYSSIPAFVEWLAADYRATKRSRTLVERLLERKRLDPDERVLLEARRDAVLSIFRIDRCDPGVALEVTDMLSGQRHTLHDRAMSNCELENVFVPLRLFHVPRDGGWTFPSIAGPPLPALEVGRALEFLGVELSPEALRADAHLLGRLWSWHLHREERPIALQNTDGDSLEPTTATFHIDDPATLARTFRKRRDLEHDEREDAWVWLNEASTVLGRLEFLDDTLVLEVNSARRLESARAWLEALPGVRFERATIHPFELGKSGESTERPLDDRLPSPPPEPLPPEEFEEFADFVRQQCLSQLDKPVPGFGHITPREACRTKEGRRRVTLWVQTMPPVSTPYGPIPAPREEILRELGLDP